MAKELRARAYRLKARSHAIRRGAQAGFRTTGPVRKREWRDERLRRSFLAVPWAGCSDQIAEGFVKRMMRRSMLCAFRNVATAEGAGHPVRRNRHWPLLRLLSHLRYGVVGR
jgi:hypothetical protein